MNSKQTISFLGTISCKSVLEQNKRQAFTLYVQQGKRTRDFSYIKNLAKQQGINIQTESKEWFDEHFPKGHGGMVLEAEPRNHLSQCPEVLTGCNILAIGIQDPYNLGSLCRNLYAFGVNYLILPPYDWSAQEATIQKASAGAYEKINILMLEYEEILQLCNNQKLPLLAASRKDAVALEDYRFPENFILAIGGALRGLPSIIEDNCDQNIAIGYERDFRNALDTPSAGAVFSYAWHLQNRGEHNE